MKRILALLCVGALILALAGCGGGSSPVKTEVSNENVKVIVTTPKGEYKGDATIPVTVVISNENKENKSIFLVKGSGSNAVPDALKVKLGDFANLFTPEVMTMDYQVIEIKAGQTESHTLPFVPYIAKDGTAAFGFDKPISFFQSADFTPAPKGTVNGEFSFTYVLAQGDEEPMAGYESGTPQTLQGTFSLSII